MKRTVAIAGLGAIGLPLARALDAGVDGLQLVSVTCCDRVKGLANLSGFLSSPLPDPAASPRFWGQPAGSCLHIRWWLL